VWSVRVLSLASLAPAHAKITCTTVQFLDFNLQSTAPQLHLNCTSPAPRDHLFYQRTPRLRLPSSSCRLPLLTASRAPHHSSSIFSQGHRATLSTVTGGLSCVQHVSSVKYRPACVLQVCFTHRSKEAFIITILNYIPSINRDLSNTIIITISSCLLPVAPQHFADLLATTPTLTSNHRSSPWIITRTPPCTSTFSFEIWCT
jgi:hypothetical protein